MGPSILRSAALPQDPIVLKVLTTSCGLASEGPDWMRGGSYVVARRIRISLEHWDRTEVDFQEQVIGRHKYSGAPIGKSGEQEPLDLDRERTRMAIR